MYKAATLVAVLGVVLVALFAVSDRGTEDLAGFLRAGADTTVDSLEDQLPQEVHDRKLNQDLRRVRQDVIDRKVQLTQSQSRIEQLLQDVAELEGSIERRERLLADAYPILKQAVTERSAQVSFASNEFTLEEFQNEVDNLLAIQSGEQRQLDVKREGLRRLEKSEQEAQAALEEMQRALDDTEQEVAVLRSRRQQAEIEAQTLDMVAVGAESDDTETLSRGLNRLRDDVGRLEARNDVQRELGPVSNRAASYKLSRHWSRMEELKAIRDRVETASPAGGESSVSAEQPENEGQTADSDERDKADDEADDDTSPEYGSPSDDGC